MLSAQDNELLTKVGSDSDCGRWLRSFWFPIAISDRWTGFFIPQFILHSVLCCRLLVEGFGVHVSRTCTRGDIRSFQRSGEFKKKNLASTSCRTPNASCATAWRSEIEASDARRRDERAHARSD